MDYEEPDISDDEIRTLVDGTITQFPNFLAELLGVKLPKKPKVTKAKREEAYRSMKSLISALKTLSRFKGPPTNPKEVLARLDAFNEVMGPLILVPRGMHVLDYFQRYFSATVNAPASWSYFSKTNYREYRDTLNEIVLKLYQNNLAQSAEKLLEQFAASPDASAMAQYVFMRLERHFGYLKDSRRKLEKRQIEKLIEIYRELAGWYEKLIRIIVGFIEILDGKEPSYESIARRRLYFNVKQVEKKLPIFTQDFNITIRNAIAHASYFLHLGIRTIDFVDRNGKVTLTFKDFFKACRSLSALVVALSFVRNVMMCRQSKNCWDYYKVLKRQRVDS